jgi:magnesium chelatase subunit I
MEITQQEAWLERASPVEVRLPAYIAETVEQLTFLAREDKRIDKRSGVSQRLPISALENVASSAESRALRSGERLAVPRVLDIYAALPSVTGKLELEYEGELKGGEAVARELVRTSVGKVYHRLMEGVNVAPIVQWFELGGSLKLDASMDSSAVVRQASSIQGLLEKVSALGVTSDAGDAELASAAEFILEGLYALRRISRSEERGFVAEERRREPLPAEEQRKPGARRQFN